MPPVKSVRLGSELETRLKRAALAANVSESEFIRDAVARRCDEVLSESLAERLAPVIGIVSGGGGRADDTGAAFGRLVRRKRRR